MSDVVFIGNGVNRVFQGDSWQSIIRNIAEAYKTPASYTEMSNIPFSMQIVAASNDNVNKAMKDIVVESLAQSSISDEQRDLLQLILDLKTTNIITTNYSFELEQAAGIKPKCSEYRKIRKYLIKYPEYTNRLRLDCYYDIEKYGQKIWHIHGDLCKPSSVIMGHYFYEKLIREIQDYIPKLIKRYKAFKGDRKQFKYKSWVDSFLIDNVHIFGFGMDFSESDIWWLICCKKRNFPDSSVTIYLPDISADKRMLLEAYNVNVDSVIQFDGDYKNYYCDVIKKLDSKIGG